MEMACAAASKSLPVPLERFAGPVFFRASARLEGIRLINPREAGCGAKVGFSTERELRDVLGLGDASSLVLAPAEERLVPIYMSHLRKGARVRLTLCVEPDSAPKFSRLVVLVDDSGSDKENRMEASASDTDLIDAINNLLFPQSQDDMVDLNDQVMNESLLLKESDAPETLENVEKLKRRAAIMRSAVAVHGRVEATMRKVDEAISNGELSLLSDVNVVLDLGVKDRLWEIFASYESAWMSLALTVLARETLVENSSSAQRAAALQAFVLCGSATAPVRVLRNALCLVLFLDMARRSEILHLREKLFLEKSEFKTSTQVLTVLCALLLAGEGDIIVHLQRLGYQATFKQLPAHEHHQLRRVETLDDLRDGIVLAALMGKEMYYHMQFPARNRTSRLANISRVIRALDLSTVSGNGKLDPGHIVDGKKNDDASLRLVLNAAMERCALRLVPEARLRRILPRAENCSVKELLFAWTESCGISFQAQGTSLAANLGPRELLALVRRCTPALIPQPESKDDWESLGRAYSALGGGVAVRLTGPPVSDALALSALASLCAGLCDAGREALAAERIQAQWRSQRVRALLARRAFAELEVYIQVVEGGAHVIRAHLSECAEAVKRHRRGHDDEAQLAALLRSMHSSMSQGDVRAASAAVDVLSSFYDSRPVFDAGLAVLYKSGVSRSQLRRMHSLVAWLQSVDRASRICSKALPAIDCVRQSLEAAEAFSKSVS